MHKVLARIRELEAEIARLKELIEANVSDRHVYTHVLNNNAKLAGALVFVGVAVLFATGLHLGWHWAWLAGIGVSGAVAVGMIAPEF